MDASVRVLLVDDHALFRRGMIALLGLEPGIEVVGEAGDAGEALRLALRTQPDVVLLDNHLPGVRGVDAIAGLREAAPGAQVLMLTVSEDSADLAAALRSGAGGYLLKTCDTDELVAAIRRARQGRVIIGSQMGAMLARAMSEPQAPASDDAELAQLTPREREIAAAIARGASNKLIGRELGIAETTVKVHVQSILRKLDLASRVQIAGWALRHKLDALTK
jgi:two-component system nitrate/nitrite response regulator NarL